MILVSHEPFESLHEAIYEEKDSLPITVYVKENLTRQFVNETDIGEELRSSIDSLHLLLNAYRKGLIIEKS